MTKTTRLITIIGDAVRSGGGIYSASDLAYMMGEPCNQAFIKFLSDRVKTGHLERVVRGLYQSAITPPEPTTAIYKIIKKMRNNVLNYISLESQLSYTGEISQLVMDRVTVVTKGRKGTFPTPYGIIEFTHTKKPVVKIMPHLYYDDEIKMYRANKEQALEDLRNCQRNLHMLDY